MLDSSALEGADSYCSNVAPVGREFGSRDYELQLAYDNLVQIVVKSDDQIPTRPHHVVAVFYVDLDNFKPINDTAGHAVGDEVLKTVALRLKEVTRSTDICARIGGDEFVVIGTQLVNEEQSLEIGNKLLAKIMEAIEINGRVYYLGASIGIAIYPKHGQDLTELMKCADSAMYEVKRSGKNRCQLFGTN